MESLKKPHKTLWMVEYFHDLWQSGELLGRDMGKPWKNITDNTENIKLRHNLQFIHSANYNFLS